MNPHGIEQRHLRALHVVLVVARTMAYDEAPSPELADVLDIAEYLVRLIADDADRSDELRACLADLARRWPAFSPALQYCDAPAVEWPW